ncbi:sulfotransferase family protein [Nocardioides sp.]|uniref:sulfotransferase family protein n=1 Tax=Nocardioides sp. TaxID=35761 RepID=UPI001A288CB5|nr:sulfotransferase family protein [Nocardioides sp.]MBJ7357188.1 sulfotransferase family protein [Nocardioides sp.]
MPTRRVVLVVGPGRSGTSALAGGLQALGMHVPPPEVPADEAGPRGSAESQWVVDLHTELLERANVGLTDARPSAWFETGKWAANGILRTRVTDWLGPQFAPLPDEEDEPELVLKDPRMAWFLGLWKAAALRVDATPAYLTTLRHVTEVVGTRDRPSARVAAWVNMMLHTERGTRGSLRAFVRYDDLLADWTIPLFRVGSDFGLRAVTEASANSMRKVHQFVDPDLHRGRHTWADLAVPPRLQELAEESWGALSGLADPDGDTAARHATLDELREAYVALYEEAEGITASTADAARREGVGTAAETDQPKGLKRLLGR